MPISVKTVATLVANPGKSEELKALLMGMVTPSRAEPGNLQYDLWQDKNDPNRFVLDERYKDEEAFAAHHASDHFQHYRSKISGLAGRTVLSLEPVQVG